MFSTIGRYISLRYLSLLVLTLPMLVLVYLVIDVFEISGHIFRQQHPAAIFWEYYSAKIALIAYQVAPAAAVLAAVFCLGAMRRDGELLAAAVLGYRAHHFLLPMLIPLLMMVGGIYLVGEFAVPPAQLAMQHVQIKKLRRYTETLNFFSQVQHWHRFKNRLYRIEVVDPRRRKMINVTMINLGPNGEVREHFRAQELHYRPKSRDWFSYNADRWQFTKPAAPFSRPQTMVLLESFQRFAHHLGNPATMTIPELVAQLRRLEAQGKVATLHKFALHTRLAIPLSALIFAIFGGLVILKFPLRCTPAGLVATGVWITVAFWVLFAIGRLASSLGAIPTSFGAWSPVILGLLAALLLATRRNAV